MGKTREKFIRQIQETKELLKEKGEGDVDIILGATNINNNWIKIARRKRLEREKEEADNKT